MPAYNAEPYIESAIASVLEQHYKNIEILVIDDGSTDRTYELASKYKSRGIFVIKQNNKGASAARNAGLHAATGDWIQFLDADDILHPEKIALQMQRTDVEGPEYIYCSDWGRFKQDVADAVFQPSFLLSNSEPVDWLIQKYTRHEMIQPGAWLSHRSLIEKSGAWNEQLSLNDDGEFFDRLVLNSQGVRYVKNAKTYYRSAVANSISSQVSRRAAESGLLAIDLCTQRLISKCDSSETRKACAVQYQLYAYQFFPIERDLANQANHRANELGGADCILPGGPNLSKLVALFGWRVARTMQYWFYRLRY
jgi:hypothetical protein